ncbi:MAG: SpoIIE family protein phosphatase [Gammaproteobacteria bacterium]|nr:SpoIIE family protein phosphatase [Gammaproteobacteria bacterium]
MFNAHLDNGVVRRVPLVASVAGYPLLSMPLECLRVAAGEPVFSIVSEPPAPMQIVIGDLALPTQPDGSVFVHYAGHDISRYVSAVDVLEGRDDPDLIAGRIALVGVVGQGLVDYQLTPNGERLPGVEVHAEVIENIFSDSLLQRPEAARGIEAACFALLALLAVAWMPRMSPLQSAMTFLASACLLLGGAVAAYLWQRQLFDPLTPLAGLTGVHALLVLAAWMMIEIERKRLSTHLAIEREASARTAGELEAARRIQTGMLPRPEKVLANEKRVQLFAHMRPAREVGGDLYDFFYLDQRRLLAVVGDVAGKGLAAALFMAVSKALTKSTSLRGPSSLGDLLELINIELVRDNPDELFVTLLAVVIDLDTGQLEYCNAGHEPLLHVRADGSVQALDDGGGPPLCVFDYIGYTSVKKDLQPGDWLALVSDGFTEAMSSDGSLWGRDAMKSALQAACAGSNDVAGSGAQVLSQLSRFEAGIDPADDQTMLLLRWLGRPAQGKATPA